MEQIDKYVDIYKHIIFTYINLSIHVIDIYLMSQKKTKYNF